MRIQRYFIKDTRGGSIFLHNRTERRCRAGTQERWEALPNFPMASSFPQGTVYKKNVFFCQGVSKGSARKTLWPWVKH